MNPSTHSRRDPRLISSSKTALDRKGSEKKTKWDSRCWDPFLIRVSNGCSYLWCSIYYKCIWYIMVWYIYIYILHYIYTCTYIYKHTSVHWFGAFPRHLPCIRKHSHRIIRFAPLGFWVLGPLRSSSPCAQVHSAPLAHVPCVASNAGQYNSVHPFFLSLWTKPSPKHFAKSSTPLLLRKKVGCNGCIWVSVFGVAKYLQTKLDLPCPSAHLFPELADGAFHHGGAPCAPSNRSQSITTCVTWNFPAKWKRLHQNAGLSHGEVAEWLEDVGRCWDEMGCSVCYGLLLFLLGPQTPISSGPWAKVQRSPFVQASWIGKLPSMYAMFTYIYHKKINQM